MLYEILKKIKILRIIKASINKKIFISQFNSSIDKSIELREIKYIHLHGKIILGSGCKLLCWKSYTHCKEEKILNPSLNIGKNFRATRNLIIQCAGETNIGDDVLIASNVSIIDFNHGMNPESNNYLYNPLKVKGVCIEDGVWIGNNVLILPGAHIGKKCIIGAGAVVCGRIPPYTISVGNPARPIKQWDFENHTWKGYNKIEEET